MQNKEEKFANISRHEVTLNKMHALVERLSEIQQEWYGMQKDYAQLIEYYYSETRHEDLELDAADFFGDLPRGVLSEDAIYNLMSDNSQVAFALMRTALDYLEP